MQAMVVKRKVAMNPVARAVMMDNFRKALVSNRIQIYMMDDGEDCEAICVNLGQTLGVIGYAADLDPGVPDDALDLRILCGGLSALRQMAADNKWQKLNTVAVDKALDAAERLNKVVKVEYVTKAWNELNRSSM